MKLIFLGSGEFGLPTLKSLVEEHDVVAVVTQPDRPAGRKRKLTATPIGQWAEEVGLTVYKCENVNEDGFVEQIKSLEADAAVVIAFGQKLGEQLIDALGQLAINLHGSLLPRYRGAAPINHAMLQNEAQTGVSVIALAQRMDAGMVYNKAAVDIQPTETAGELHDRLALLGPNVVGEVLERLEAGTLEGEVQDEMLATKAPKLSRADATLDFGKDATIVRCHIHGLTPWPGVSVEWHCRKSGKDQALRLLRVIDEPGYGHDAQPGKVLDGYRVATGKGAIRLLEVQPPGKKAMGIEDFANGHHFGAGDTLS